MIKIMRIKIIITTGMTKDMGNINNGMLEKRPE